ncbi:hypothetical protein Tco_1223539 [Tanacetum coccineum]
MAAANVPAENALAPDPPVRSDDQILPYSSWVPIGRSNYLQSLPSTFNWDTIRHDKKTEVNEANQFVPPIPSNDLIDFVLQLGYPKDISGVSYMYTNDIFQPWRAILSLINMCLTGKTFGYDRPRHPVV